MRFLLGQLTVHVLRRDAGMRAWFGRIKRRRGAKIARVAVMRRLTVIIWHMLSKQESYRCGGVPVSLRRQAAQAAAAAQQAEIRAEFDAALARRGTERRAAGNRSRQKGTPGRCRPVSTGSSSLCRTRRS